MYLLLSIAAADLWSGIALVLEGRGSGNFVWFQPRRIFGVCLLITFGALLVASMRVLFSSSFENADLVLGAAAVLFIADIDEKGMVPLSNVGGEWRLFWVLELVGLSLGLAVLVAKLTGSDEAIREGHRCEWVWETAGCGIYSWWFILYAYPVTATAFALLATRAISRPASSAVVRVFCPPSPSWVLFSVILSCLVSYTALIYSLGGFRLWEYVSPSMVGITVCGGFAFTVAGSEYFRKLKTAYTTGALRWRSVDRRRRRWLFLSGVVISLAIFVLNLALLVIRERENISDEFEEVFYYSVYEPCLEVLDALQSLHFLALDAWLMFGMESTKLFSPGFLVVDPSWALPSLLRSLLIGF
ncbi:unnamed protein product [Pylaiella littoralis]